MLERVNICCFCLQILCFQGFERVSTEAVDNIVDEPLSGLCIVTLV